MHPFAPVPSCDAVARRRQMYRRLAKRRLKKVGTATVCVFLLAVLARPERSVPVVPDGAPSEFPVRRGPSHTKPSALADQPFWRPAGEVLRRNKTITAPSLPFLTAAQQQERRETMRRWNLIYRLSSQYRVRPELARRIHDAAIAEGIEPELGFRLVRVESEFSARAVSSAGAIGLTQVMLSTARLFDRNITREELLNPDVNLRIGFRYLRRLVTEYRGDLRLALLVYNRGPVAVQKALSLGEDPANGYEQLVTRGYRGRGVLD
jgi:hypothetical protein